MPTTPSNVTTPISPALPPRQVANKRYREKKPVLDDKEYDLLRRKLKDAGARQPRRGGSALRSTARLSASLLERKHDPL